MEKKKRKENTEPLEDTVEAHRKAHNGLCCRVDALTDRVYDIERLLLRFKRA